MSDQAAPVTASERIASIDVLRGFALCGILTMNILMLGLPDAAKLNPNVAGGFTGFNYIAWLVGFFLFDGKMITIFSMLFGAGLVLMTDRADQIGKSPAKLYYRRVGILLVIGLMHAYLIWERDILVTYALCGMLAYPFRKLSPRNLLVVGVLFTLPSVALMSAGVAILQSIRDASIRVRAAEQNGQAISDRDRERAEDWDAIRREIHPTASEVAETIQENRESSYWNLVVKNAPEVFFDQIIFFGFLELWTVTGRMLIGMALMKLGVFSATRSMRFYALLALVGYGLGWPIVAFAANRLIQNEFDVVIVFRICFQIKFFDSLLVSLGHIGVVMLVCKADCFPWLASRLAAVGRMALTNYLMQSLLCTTFFNGYGFGFYGAFDRVQLYGIVVAVWGLQLWYSPLWLRYFRFGPIEWLWRSMTYGTIQPVWNVVKA